MEVKVVSVLASVRDKHGKAIADLSKDDFVLTEDGKPQTITYFARESDLPLRLGLMVDTSLSQRRLLGEERDASYGFLDHLVRVDKDLAFVIHFDREVELLQEFTASRPKLRAHSSCCKRRSLRARAGVAAAAEVAVGTVVDRAVPAVGAAVEVEDRGGVAAGERYCMTVCIWRQTN